MNYSIEVYNQNYSIKDFQNTDYYHFKNSFLQLKFLFVLEIN